MKRSRLLLAALALMVPTDIPADEGELQARRQAMAREATRGVAGTPRIGSEVRRVLAEVPRHRFVPEAVAPHAYENRPLPIGHGQTISQPFIVALMTQLLRPWEAARVLEIGTGSGYQAAVLSRLAREVYTIEIVEPLGVEARERLARLGYSNVQVRIGDGYAGWPEAAPFDAIMVTAGAEEVPQPLIDQLKPGGRMVIPVGPTHAVQELVVVEKNADGGTSRRTVIPVRFVPFTRKP